jgi:hypothetical protein
VAHPDKLQMLERIKLEDYLSQSSSTNKNKKEKKGNVFFLNIQFVIYFHLISLLKIHAFIHYMQVIL